MGRGIGKYSTVAAAAVEEPIAPSVKIDYTKLLINGQFVDAASGEFFFSLFINGTAVVCVYRLLSNH